MATLISDEYRELQSKLHENPDYGMASVEYAPIVSAVINKLKVKELIDYGAGKCRLAENLTLDHKCRVIAYDPAIPQLSELPDPSEMVVSIDVLEHIEPDCLDDVLNHIRSLTKKSVFVSVHCGPANKTLPDGRNAHLIQQPREWWFMKLSSYFQIEQYTANNQGFWCIMIPRKTNGECKQ